VRRDLAELLHRETAAMNLDNFVVRPRRRIVEQYAKPEAWKTLTPEARSSSPPRWPACLPKWQRKARKRQALRPAGPQLQLALLRAEPAFRASARAVIEIAGLLEEKSAIPMVREQMVLIQAVQTDDWWQDVTVAMLEGCAGVARAGALDRQAPAQADLHRLRGRDG
jgi:type I restriction enzyme R subunit